MNLVNKIYTVYASAVFLLLLVILFPLYLILAQKKSWHKYNHILNQIWTGTFSILCFMPIKVEFRQKLDKKKSYIYCSNHFSYFDIPSMAFTPSDFMFTGKESLTKAPVLGYVFKKFHITVNRFSSEGRKSALMKYNQALDEGKSLVIFPEGGIYAKDPPQMGEFKHGAFTTAIQKKTPIVPVTIPYNWKIMQDDGKFLIKRRTIKVIYHEPVETAHLTLEDIEPLKKKVYHIIQEELNKYNKYEHRQGNTEEDRPLSQVRL
jgi:1-acyl-sn-glycerol-3-phosphate acyltransferase